MSDAHGLYRPGSNLVDLVAQVRAGLTALR